MVTKIDLLVEAPIGNFCHHHHVNVCVDLGTNDWISGSKSQYFWDDIDNSVGLL